MILASILVYQCNNCGAIASVNILDDIAEKEFRNSWYDGLLKDFCPKCKDLEITQYDQQLERQAAQKKFGKTPEYIN